MGIRTTGYGLDPSLVAAVEQIILAVGGGGSGVSSVGGASGVVTLRTVGGVTLTDGGGDIPVSGTYAGLTDKVTVDLPATNTPLATALSGKVDLLAQATLGAGSTNITRAGHLNRPCIVNQAGATGGVFAVTGTSGALAGDSFYLRNTGAGTFTASGAITAPTGFKLTAGPNEAFSADYDSVDDAFYSTTPSASSGGVAANLNNLVCAPFRWIGPRSFVGDNQNAAIGISVPTQIDSCTFGTAAVTDGSFGYWQRNRYVAAAAAVNRGMGYVLTSVIAALRLDASGTPHGGFPVRIPFSIGHGSSTGMRVFVGISGAPSGSDYTADPSARTGVDSFFIGADAADTNLYVGWNDNVSTPTKTTLGANYPKAADTPYIAIFDHVAGVMQLTLLNVGTGNITTVVQSGGDAPRTTIPYGLQAMAGTGTDTTSDTWDVGIVTLGGPANTIGT